MDPFSGLSDQVEMQVKIEQRQAGFVRRHRAGDHALVNGLVFQKDLGRFDPGFIDLSAANLLVAVAQVQPDETDQFLRIAGCRRAAGVLKRIRDLCLEPCCKPP
jgi:hypothetical protein